MKRIGESSLHVNTGLCMAATVRRFMRADNKTKARRPVQAISLPVLQDRQALAGELHLVRLTRMQWVKVKPRPTSRRQPWQLNKVNKIPRQAPHPSLSNSDLEPTVTHLQPQIIPRTSAFSRAEHNNPAEPRPHPPETHLLTRVKALPQQVAESLLLALVPCRTKLSTRLLASVPPLLSLPLSAMGSPQTRIYQPTTKTMSGPPQPLLTLRPARRRAVWHGATAAEFGVITKTPWASKHPSGARRPISKGRKYAIHIASLVGARLIFLLFASSAPCGFCQVALGLVFAADTLGGNIYHSVWVVLLIVVLDPSFSRRLLVLFLPVRRFV